MLMQRKITRIPNTMVGESTLPNFGLTPAHCTEFVRVTAFNELNSPLDSYIDGWRQQQVDMIWHEDKSVKRVTTFTPVVIQNF